MSADLQAIYTRSSSNPDAVGRGIFSNTIFLATLGLLLIVSIQVAWSFVGFNPVISDVLGYRIWSHSLLERAGGWHLPGYPLLIALARVLTLGLVPDLPLMTGVCFAAWVFGLVLMARILSETAPTMVEIGVLAYAFFPLIGITHVAHPLADTLAQTLFLGAFYATVKDRKWVFLSFTAAGLIVHMVLWPFLLLMSILWLVEKRMTVWHLFVSGLPLAFYYGAIAIKSSDWLWFFRQHYQVNFKSSVTFPLFNAIIGPLSTGSIAGIIKAVLVLSVILVAVWLIVFALKRGQWLTLTIVLPILFFAATVNAHEAFIVVRYGRFLVIPICFWMASKPVWRTAVSSRWCMWATAAILMLSQCVWAAYTAKHYMD